MDWMVDPAGISAVLADRKQRTETAAQDKPLSSSELLKMRVDREISEGKREGTTGLPYGLYKPKSGGEWLEEEEEAANDDDGDDVTQRGEGASAGVNASAAEVTPSPVVQMSDAVRAKMMRPGQRSAEASSSSSGTGSGSGAADGNGDAEMDRGGATAAESSNAPPAAAAPGAATASVGVPAWKQKMLDKQRAAGSSSSSLSSLASQGPAQGAFSGAGTSSSDAAAPRGWKKEKPISSSSATAASSVNRIPTSAIAEAAATFGGTAAEHTVGRLISQVHRAGHSDEAVSGDSLIEPAAMSDGAIRVEGPAVVIMEAPSSSESDGNASQLAASSSSSSSSFSGASSSAAMSSRSNATVNIPTEADLNKLHAAAMRAQLLGNNKKYEDIQAQISRAKEARDAAARASNEISLAAVAADTLPAHARPSATTAGRHADLTGPTGAGFGQGAAIKHHHPGPSVGAGVKRRRDGAVQDVDDDDDGAGHGSGAASRQPDSDRADMVEVVAGFDSRGMPLASLATGITAPLERDDIRSGQRQGKHKGYQNKKDEDGGRTGWVPDDVKMKDSSITDLLRQERESAPDALDRTLAKNILRAGSSYKGMGLQKGDKSGREEVDEGADEDIARAMTSHEARLTAHEKQKRDKSKAISAHNKISSVMSNCSFCFDNTNIKKHLIVSLGDHSFLMVAPDGGRVPGHMLLVPLPHIVAMTDADEEVYDEINKFKAALHAFYSSRDEDVIFMETAMHNVAGRKHCVIDVIPMDKEIAYDAPIYYKKAILDSEEWTTNKQIVDTAGKGLRRCIPKGFAYFHVAWAGGGFVHPIEDETRFPANFGIDVAAGMLGLPPGRFGSKEQRTSFDLERRLVTEFVREWSPFDWTQQMASVGAPSSSSAAAPSNSRSAAVGAASASAVGGWSAGAARAPPEATRASAPAPPLARAPLPAGARLL